MPGPATDPTPSLLHQAEALRDSLSSALSDTRDLIGLTKRHKKQNHLVETTLRSLKQLDHVGAERQPYFSAIWPRSTHGVAILRFLSWAWSLPAMFLETALF
jgi:hypothetical protein